MKGKILVAIAVLIIAVSAYQIFAYQTTFEKANAQIFSENSAAEYENSALENYSADFEDYLKSCKAAYGAQKKYIETENAEISGLAGFLTNGKKTDFEKTKALFDFAANNISYSIYGNWRYANDVLQTKDGDCTDKSILLVSMLKDRGIGAYVVYGKKANDYSHAWVAANVNGRWLQIDPTAGEFYYFYGCRADEKCEYHDYYTIIGMFNENEVLEC